MSAIRYSFGGDEHVFAEIGEEMSLEAFFKGMAICTELEKRRIAGVSEICPSNASYLVRFDPDVVHPDKMLSTLKEIEAEIGDAELELPTRIVEIPVLYNDPWTRETLMRFRERHQDPSSTDLEYGARINGYGSVDEFIAAHAGAPWFVPMVGFVAGVPWLYQMVERAKQIEVPKYLRPRTTNASFEFRLRSAPRYRVAIANGTGVVTLAGKKADCVITADPVTFLLLGLNRVPQLPQLLRGKLRAGGRKPWLAAKFGTLLESP